MDNDDHSLAGDSDTLPNFLIVGAAKSGTTFLNNILLQHTGVFLPTVKESRFFSNINKSVIDPFTGNRLDGLTVVNSFEKYRNLFSSARGKVAIGDVSPDYLFYHREAIPRIHKFLGSDVKIIILLRNPVNRAYSNYYHLIRDQLTSIGFSDYMKLEASFPEDVWYGFKVLQAGFYENAVKDYLDNFPNVKVVLFEDLVADVESVLTDIQGFLGLPEISASLAIEKNKTGTHRFKFLKTSIDFLARMKGLKHTLNHILPESFVTSTVNKIKEMNLKKDKMGLTDRQYLNQVYHEDITSLEALIGRDLQVWKGMDE